MNVLVACEESQAVCKEFRKLGHAAFSADIKECSGGHSEWHIKGDVLPLLNGNSAFTTMDGANYRVAKWDLIISHPPCTYLTTTGNRWFNVKKYGDKAIMRLRNREDAIKFFMAFISADCERIAIENPVGYMSTYYRKPDQIIQPWMFGDAAEKRTCLWLKGLPKLRATKIVKPPERIVFSSGRSMPRWYADAWNLSKEKRSQLRSKTFPGVARAMALQWGGIEHGEE